MDHPTLDCRHRRGSWTDLMPAVLVLTWAHLPARPAQGVRGLSSQVLGSGGHQPLEQVLVLNHQPLLVHQQVCLEAGREPEVDIAQPLRTQTVIPLTGNALPSSPA